MFNTKEEIKNTVVISEESRGHYRVRIEGRIDTCNASLIQNSLVKIAPYAASIEIDCSKLLYISSSGLRALLTVQKIMPDEEKIRLVNVLEDVYGTFDITGFTSLMEVKKAKKERRALV